MLVQKLSDPAYNISMENHEFGLPPYNYDKFSVLKDTYDVLSTTLDRCVRLPWLGKKKHTRFHSFSVVCQNVWVDTSYSGLMQSTLA